MIISTDIDVTENYSLLPT